MTRTDGALTYQRLRAPDQHGEALITPPLTATRELVRQNVARIRQYDYDCQGRQLRQLMGEARQHLLRRARQ